MHTIERNEKKNVSNEQKVRTQEGCDRQK